MPDVETTAQAPKPRRRRRWLRRIAVTLGVIVLLLVLLILFLPTILTSKWMENKIASIAGERIGRDVDLEDLRFGWRTELHLGRLAIHAAPDEPQYNALLLEDLHVPLTLMDVLGGLPISAKGEIDNLEVNLVKLEDGGWNWLRIKETASANQKPKEEKPPSPPSALPISDLHFKINHIETLVIDEGKGLTAGWERGSVEAMWTGGVAPLTVDAGGELRINDQRMPWDVRAKVSHWVNEDQFVTTDTITIVASSDGMIDEHQILDGGFFVAATVEPNEKNVARIVLPLQRFRDLAAAAPLPAEAPQIAGELDLTTHFTHADEFKKWEIELQLLGNQLSAVLPVEQAYEIPPQDLRVGLNTALDLNAKRLETLELDAKSDFLAADVNIREMDFAEPLDAQELTFSAHADFGRATALAASILGKAGEPPVEGTLLLNGDKLSSGAEIPAFRLNIDFDPVVLRSLEPFAANPDFLSTQTLDLRPLALVATIDASHDPVRKRSHVTILEWQNSLVTEFQLDAVAATEPLAWQAEIAAALNLHDLFEAYGRRFAPVNLTDLNGDLELDLAAMQMAQGDIATSGSLQISGFVLADSNLAYPVADDEISLLWDVAANPAAKSAAWNNVELNTSFLALQTSGNYGEQIDLQLAAETNLARAMLFAAPWTTLPGALGGDLTLETKVSGRLNEAIEAELLLGSSGPITYVQQGLVNFSQPITVEAVAAVEYLDSKPAKGNVTVQQFQIGSLAEAEFETNFDMTGESPTEGALALMLDFSEALALADPELYQQRGFDAVILGQTNLEIQFAGLVHRDEQGVLVYPEPWEASGAVVTELESIEWAFNDLDGYIENFADEREFTLVFAPDNSTSPTYHDQAVTGFDLVDGPKDIVVRGFEMESSIAAEMPNRAQFTIANSVFDETSYRTDTLGVTIPQSQFSGDFIADLAASVLNIRDMKFSVQDAAEFVSNTQFAWADKTWSTETELNIASLGNTLTLVELAEVSTGWLRTLAGSARMTANLQGIVPQPDSSLLAGLPLHGEITMQAEDVGIEMPRRMSVRDFDADSLITISEDGKNADFTLDMAVARFANTALQNKPFDNITIAANANLVNFDELSASLDAMTIENYLLDMDGSFSATGIQRAMRDELNPGLGKWLRNMRMNGELRVQQDLEGWSGFKDPLNSDGILDFSLSLLNDPASSMRINAFADVRDTEMHWGDMFHAAGINGTWEGTKTLMFTRTARKAVSPPAGLFTFDRIGFSTAMVSGEIAQASIAVRGLEEGLTLDFGSRNFLGGSAKATANLVRSNEDPVITARIEATGVDMAQLAKSPYGREANRADELNGTGTFSWRFERTSGTRFLDDITLELKSTRIGEAAFARLLRALDADQDDPRFQNALAALRIGQPISATFLLQNSLTTFTSELRLPGGFRTPLPILERQPLGDLLEVYQFDEFAPLVELTRWGLLLVLSPDLQTFEAVLAAPETNQ